MNHMIIGLGGTGGKIIRAFRKLIYQEFRKEKPDGVELGYLYIDSSNEMMGLGDPSWKTLGTSVQLPQASQLLISEANLAARLDNLDNYPGIKPWIGDRAQWREILNSIIGVVLGGQRRRLGRFLFACKADRFKEQVQTQVRKLQATGATETVFHVLTGLAGGTGSGSVIDVLAQLREMYPDPKRYRIILYALLPDQYPPPNWDTGNYHANGYAALTELNALSTGAYQPYDVLGLKSRLGMSDPFNGCYVFTNENENGLTIDVDKEIPNIVADFLHQKIISAKSVVSWPTLMRMENAENGDGSPETTPNSKVGERSKRFLTFGIKRVAIPEEEIAEFLSFNFARQAILQLRYNHWQDGFGFNETGKNQEFNTFVRQADVQTRWLITDDHLLQSLGILPEDVNNKRWKTIEGEWEAVLPSFKSVAREQDRSTWLDELTKLCRKRFDTDYRGMGVANFYQTKLKARKDIAREVRSHIEQELFNEWKIGVKSTLDISRVLAALIDHLDERLKNTESKANAVRGAEEETQERVIANARKWSEMGFLSKSLLGKPDNLLDAHALLLQEIYIYRTRIAGLGFAKQILQEIIAEITALHSELDRINSIFQEGLKKLDTGIRERCRDEGEVDLRRYLVRFYNPDLVKKLNRQLIVDENVQRTQTNKVRAALLDKLGERADFSVFSQRISKDMLLDTLETVCEESARIAHNNLTVHTKDRVLGESIIGKLKERFGSDTQALREYVTRLVTEAGNYISFEPLEMQKVAPGIPTGVQTAVSKLTVILPQAPEHAEFMSALREAFRSARSGDVEIIETEAKPNEITLVSIANLFPLRYIKSLPFLRQRYEQRIAGLDTQRLRMLLHTEGDGKQFPAVFVASVDEVKQEGLAYMLLARALGLVQDNRHPDTGVERVSLHTKDADGIDNPPITLGKTFVDAWEGINIDNLLQIRTAVESRLNSRDYQHVDQRTTVQQALLTQLETLKTMLTERKQEDAYWRFAEGAKKAMKILKGET